ncbi:MAG: ABC transporter ATP-binding protein [Peptostreptococcus anaerobius]
MSYIEIKNLGKVYGTGDNRHMALDGVDLNIDKGEFVAIMGPSGSGKTTFLNMVGGLDKPTSGRIFINGIDICSKSKSSLARYRRRDVGIVFQNYNLVRILSARENIKFPIRLDHKKPDLDYIDSIINKLGIGDKGNKFPDQLSGGEQQRVAIARAMVTKPMLLLADEPTGNLDSDTGMEILRLIRKIVDEEGQTVIMITHDEEVAKIADRVVYIRDGVVEV